jgi:uncharacterized protein YigE (DUF2233 family)
MSANYARLTVCLPICVLVVALMACDLAPSVKVNGTPVVTTSPNAASGSSTPVLNTWSTVASGVEVRTEHWKSPGDTDDIVTIVRMDMQRIHLSVGYQPQPITLSQWMSQTQARVVINGGYFDAQYHPTGLLIANGNAYGTSYQGFGGMLSVNNKGKINLRSLSGQPYDADNESLRQVIQSSPMLMDRGQRTQFNANAVSDRRSVVAVDTRGRLLLIASPGQAFSLDELADLLASSDLSIQTALNLDGGASTGLYVNANTKEPQVAIDPLTPVPIVIAIK